MGWHSKVNWGNIGHRAKFSGDQSSIPSIAENMLRGFVAIGGVKIWLFPLHWLLALTTACTTVQAVTKQMQCDATVLVYLDNQVLRRS